jgi:outer membrane immunogenic protein
LTVFDPLFYLTAGGAWGSAKDTANFNVSGLPFTLSTSGSKLGWAAGLGGETYLGAGFSAKLEYLFLYFDKFNLTGTLPASLGGGTITQTGTVQDHIFRVGINYRFGAR